MKTKRECSTVLFQWNGGQSSSIYAVASYFINDQDYPNLEVVASAADELDRLRSMPEDKVSSEYHLELKQAAKFLREYVQEQSALRAKGPGF